MQASTIDLKPHHPVPNLYPIYEVTRWNKSVTQTAKAECLAKSFFPQVPSIDLEDIGLTVHPDPVAFLIIEIKEIPKAILKFPSQSAPGTDNIPNKILKTGLLLIIPCLPWLFNSSLNLGYCPRHF